MKKFSFLALAAAGMLFSACSDKDEIAQVNPVNSPDFKDGAFIGLSLQLPSADNTTRANDELSNGTEEEFAVKNATLYIFKLAATSTANPDEAATYVDQVTLGTSYTEDTQGGIDPDQWGVQDGVDATKITSTYNDAALIPNDLASTMKQDTENKYYAYVIVNHNGQLPPVTEETTFKVFSDAQFSEIGADIAAKANIKESGLLMTNAPICSVPGGSAAPVADAKYTTLVELDNTKIFGSKAQAQESPAGCVYIERAAVKITVEDGRADAGNATTINELDVTIVGWQVINYEPTYYNTRHIETVWGGFANEFVTPATATNKYRFVSLYKFEPTLPGTTGHTTGYRTYFAKDPHYNVNALALTTEEPIMMQSSLKKTVASDNDADWIAVGKTNHAYTTENTFDVGRQTWQNTTMVTVKAKIGTNGFYTVGKGSQIMLATLDDAKAAIQNVIKNDPAVTLAYNALLDKISDNNRDKEVKAGLNINITEEPTVGTTDVKFTFELAYTVAGQAATYEGTGESDLKEALEDAIINVIMNPETEETTDAVLLSYYKDGISYYNARIQHFGEAETPWDATADYITGGGTNVKEIYGYDLTKGDDHADNEFANKNFLGRYGVVRDNWYKLSIDKIGKIGTAEPVDPSKTTPDTPDDEIENYISVHVHIVPWVLRSQSVQF